METEKLMGVWSSVLFQTEAKYDSMVLKPAKSPIKATLYKNGKETVFKLTKNGDGLSFKGESGLRFDATLPNNAKSVYGLITDDLWVQNLQFKEFENSWVAKVVKPEIIDTDYEVFLEFYEDSLNMVKAKIQSNKENRELHFKIDSVKVDGNDIDFKITNDRFGISAEYDPKNKNLFLYYGNMSGKRKVSLTKMNPSRLKGYKPMVDENYTYEIPEPIDASIPVASLNDVGINRSMLDFIPKMNSGEYDHIHGIIITKNKKLVFEEYFHGYNREYLHDIKSSFKSISSLWLGKMMMKDESINVNNPIVQYYPEYDILDEDKKKITVHHALTMSTGLQQEDEDEMQWGNEDWVGYELNLPIAHKPGEKYQYSSGGMNLLTGVIQSGTDNYLPQFLYEEILGPMNINRFQMRVSPVGRAYLPGDFYLRPIDFTKFGLLLLNEGSWNNRQIIESEWIDVSTRPHMKGSWPIDSDYGYLWRLLERKVGGKMMKTIEAWGNGGQFLIVIPEIEMTITFTGGNYNLFPEMEDKPMKILNEYILPAVEL